MAGLRAAPAARAALTEATLLWPDRNRASDGIIGDAAHSAGSDHRDPDGDGYAEAFDLTHDPEHGVDCHVLSLWLMADPRVKYIIFNRRIWNPSVSPHWRPYSGASPHTHHMHVSLKDSARDDIRPWWVRLVQQGNKTGDLVMPEVPCYSPIKFFVPTASGKGYYIVCEDGAVYAFGDAGYYGRVIVKKAAA